MDNSEDLRVLLASQYPLLLVETREEERFLGILRAVASELDVPVWVWSATQGLARDGHPAQYRTADPVRAIDFVGFLSAPGVFVFADAHPAMKDSLVVRRLKEVAAGVRTGQTLILTAPRTETPPELTELAHRWSLRPPSKAELEALVKRTIADLEERDFPVTLDDSGVSELARALSGVTLREASRLIQRAVLADGRLAADDVPRILHDKATALAGNGILELIESGASLADVAGFHHLKEWLQIRDRAGAAGLDPPRGILLTGIPGCGKSLVAKAIARSRAVPLVLLDPALLYSKYIGESEQRLAASLDAIDAMAPAVLWIDEIEKGFATGGTADGGVGNRLLGTFLRWMQERPPGVMLVATANDVAALPPELLRKGRFDEIFFVDLPDEPVRQELLRIHLEKRGLDAAGVDRIRLARLADGFSGAEIETAVVGALYRAAAGSSPIGTEAIATEIAATVPLAVARAEEVNRLRGWAAGRAISA